MSNTETEGSTSSIRVTFSTLTFGRIMRASRLLFGKEDSETDFIRSATMEKLRNVERENAQALGLTTGETK